MKKYIVYNNNKIGYIENICICEKCKDRGRAEVFINDLDDCYLDCIRANEIEDIIYLGNSITEAIGELTTRFEREIETKDKVNKCLQGLVDLYSKLK